MVEEAEESFSFAKALRDKYADYEPKLFDNIQLSPKRRAALINKQGHEQRQVLALDGCKVGSAGEDGEISEICPNLLELDLAKNFLQSWEQVFKIICQLPKLTFLNLSCNPLNWNYDEERIYDIVRNNNMPKLKNLVLNNTKVPFELVFKIIALFPELEELHLSLNSYGHVVEWPATFPNIKKLHFNSNDLEEWDDVLKIGKIFPKLKSLILCENFIKEVALDSETEIFQDLETLSLSKTEIEEWKSLDEIRKFPALEDLRIVGVPLGRSESGNEKRQLFISRLPNVKKLNGSQIDENEREDAERMFIRYYMDNEDPPERYHELVEIHGQLERLAEVDMSAKEYAQIKLIMDKDESTKVIVDLSIDVKTLKQNISKKVGLKPREFRLFYIESNLPREMKRPTQRLWSYQIKDGDEIVVQKRC